MKRQKFSKVSQWIDGGNMATGLYLFETIEKESEKAIAVPAQKPNQFGFLKPCACWFPKSQIQEVENDFYINAPKRVFLVPDWLMKSKQNEGFEL